MVTMHSWKLVHDIGRILQVTALGGNRLIFRNCRASKELQAPRMVLRLKEIGWLNKDHHSFWRAGARCERGLRRPFFLTGRCRTMHGDCAQTCAKRGNALPGVVFLWRPEACF